MSHIFISYSRRNVEFADNLLQSLRDQGFEVWMDSVLPAGYDWRQEIDQAIRESFVMLVLVSPESKASEYVTFEWAFALGSGIKVIPLVVEPVSLHPRLESVQHIDFSKPEHQDLAWNPIVGRATVHVAPDKT